MHTLTENFLIFTICGCWMPDGFTSSKCKSTLYKYYRLIILTNACVLIVLKIINLSRGFNSVEQCASLLLSLPDFISGIVKAITIYNNRKKLYDIDELFFKCQRMNNGEVEIKIRDGFDFMCRYVDSLSLHNSNLFLKIDSIVNLTILALILSINNNLLYLILFHFKITYFWMLHFSDTFSDDM